MQTKFATLCECDCMKSGEIRERKRIVKMILATYTNPEEEEYGSFVWTGDIIELIEKGEVNG